MTAQGVLGMMQPYFFPHLGYFDLINRSDHWVVFDTAQYIRHGWVNRNRILHPNKGWQYISVPLEKRSFKDSIRKVRTNQEIDWLNRILGQLQHYKKQAPYFDQVSSIVKVSLDYDDPAISKLNVNALEIVCEYIGIKFKYTYFSEMDLDLAPIQGPGDWALQISKALGVKAYINPPGGQNLFDAQKFDSSGIQLHIRETPIMEYGCRKYQFVPGLSIIDVLMWNSPEKVRDFLNAQETVLPGKC